MVNLQATLSEAQKRWLDAKSYEDRVGGTQVCLPELQLPTDGLADVFDGGEDEDVVNISIWNLGGFATRWLKANGKDTGRGDRLAHMASA